MIIEIKVIAKAKVSRVNLEKGILKVYLHSAPEKGKANAELIKVLAEHYGVTKNQITIIRGIVSHHKTIEITLAKNTKNGSINNVAKDINIKTNIKHDHRFKSNLGRKHSWSR